MIGSSQNYVLNSDKSHEHKLYARGFEKHEN